MYCQRILCFKGDNIIASGGRMETQMEASSAKTMEAMDVIRLMAGMKNLTEEDMLIELLDYYLKGHPELPFAKQDPSKPVQMKTPPQKAIEGASISQDIKLTQEQEEILDFAKTGKNMLVNAYAGSGKTFILRKIAQTNSRDRFMYLAFNKGLQVSASESFPKNTWAKTAHSLAWGGMGMSGNPLAERLNQRMKTIDLAAKLGIRSDKSILIARGALLTANTFENSADYKIESQHIPKEAKIDLGKYFDGFESTIVDLAKRIWEDRLSSKGSLPITHNTYLKLWQMSAPRINCSTLLFDEAQDANPVILDIVRRQTCRKIFVGDKYQQIYAWRGAINALSNLENSHKGYLSQSFRFGNHIAQYASKVLELKGENRLLKGLMDTPSQVEEGLWLDEPYTHIFRTNSALLLEAAKIAERKKKLYIFGDVNDLLDRVRSTYALYKKKRSDVVHPTIKIYENWDELEAAAEFELELNYLVKFVDEFGKKCPEVIRKIERFTTLHQSQAKVLLTTAHKAKGLEWHNIKLSEDFNNYLEIEDDDPMDIEDIIKLKYEELNLLYVAVTRSIRNLSLPKGMDELLGELLQMKKDVYENNELIV